MSYERWQPNPRQFYADPRDPDHAPTFAEEDAYYTEREEREHEQQDRKRVQPAEPARSQETCEMRRARAYGIEEG